MKILLTGGGTLGSVTPLLALVEAWRKQDTDVSFVWVGTSNGPERKLLKEDDQIKFYSIPTARLPRYLTKELFLTPFRFIKAMVLVYKIIKAEKVDLIIGAGGFTQVPVIFAGKMIGVPAFALQSDVRPLLSTTLIFAFIQKLFVGWKQTAAYFNSKKVIVTGVPVRKSMLEGSKEEGLANFGLDASKPTLLVFGGGTGATWLNEQIAQIAPQLCREMNVLHVTGIGKKPSVSCKGYVALELLGKEMADAYAIADLVVARAGLGTISELAALKKPVIFIPLPKSPQVLNAQALDGAAVILEQEKVNSEKLLAEIRLLMRDKHQLKVYGEQLGLILKTDVAKQIIEEIIKKPL